MRFLLTVFFCFTAFISFGQGTLVPFGGTRPIDTAYAARSLRIDSNVRFIKYATNDTNKVLAVDGAGRMYLATKGSGFDPTAIHIGDFKNDAAQLSRFGQFDPIDQVGVWEFEAKDPSGNWNGPLNVRFTPQEGFVVKNDITSMGLSLNGGLFVQNGPYGPFKSTILSTATADRFFTLQNKSGTVALLEDTQTYNASKYYVSQQIAAQPQLNLQNTLNGGNTATGDINLIGNIDALNITADNISAASIVQGTYVQANNLVVANETTLGQSVFTAPGHGVGVNYSVTVPAKAGTLAMLSDIPADATRANNGVTKVGDTVQLGDTVRKAITVNLASTGSLGFLGIGTNEQPIRVHGLRYFNQNNRRNIVFTSVDPTALLNNANVTRSAFFGAFAFQAVTNGTQNVGIGHDPGNSCLTCNNNIAIGPMALYTETSINNAIAIGNGALRGTDKGGGDIGLGQEAGSNGTTLNSVFLGNFAGYNLSGTNNTVVGNWTNASPNRTISNMLFLGGDGTSLQNVNIGGFTDNGAKLQVTGNTTVSGTLNVGSVTEYADNAAAVGAGLSVGTLYRTGDVLKIVH